MTGVGGLPSALREWAEAIGDANISADGGDAASAPSTIGASRHIPVVLRPDTAEQVVDIVRIARRWRIPIYPLSTGHNWGYGSANPVRDGCAVVELAKLDRILDFDPELGVVTVEPGVTQGALAAFLDARDAGYLVPVTGAGPNCSLVGNALERGYGITPVTDHFAAVTTIEAVLPDGRLYRTPLTELGGGEIDRLFKWGVGPYLDGVFTQGNYGIVLRMTIALACAPEATTAFFFGARDDAALEELVPAIRRVLGTLGGTVPAINLLNRQRMLSMMAPFPADDATDGVVVPEAVERLSREYRIQPWNGVGGIYGSREVVRAAKRTLKRLLGPATNRLVFVNSGRLAAARGVARLLPEVPRAKLRGLADTLESTLQIMNGRPSTVALPLAYWRSGTRPEEDEAMNPAQDGCGLIWYAPLVPMRAEAARRHAEIVERICPQYGINPLITFTTVNDRCFDSTVPLLFNSGEADATARARECYRALVRAGQKEGFLPYRLNIDAMELLHADDSVFTEIAAQFKAVLDPQHLIAPGRYVPDTCKKAVS